MVNKTLLLAVLLLGCRIVFSQVGINTISPGTTLDVNASSTNNTTAEGIIAPRLTGNQIQDKDAVYLAAQTGALVYATNAVSGATTPKTVNITTPGYYYFDGTTWQKFGATSVIFTASLGSGAGSQSNFTAPQNGFRTVNLPNVGINIGGGLWNDTNNTYSVPITGTYLIKSSIRLRDGSTASPSRNIFQAVHTSNQDIPDGIWQTNNGNRWSMLYTRIANFNQGDLLRLYIYSDGRDAVLSDASLNITLLNKL